jgi:hypothetical protein
LFLPPVSNSWFLRSAMAWERVGAALSLPFAGVHIVEATKQVYRAIPAHRERTRLIPSLEPVLVPSSTATGRGVFQTRRPRAGTTAMPRALLLIPRIEIFARRQARHAADAGLRRLPARKTRAATTFISAGRAIHLRLRSGDEGGQAINAACIGNHRLRLGLGLILRLRPVLAFAMVFARLLLEGSVPVAALFTRIVVSDVGLRLLRDEARPGRNGRSSPSSSPSSAVGACVDARLRLVLPKLLWAAAIRRK